MSLSSISGDQPHTFRAQAADTAARSLKAAEPELEKLIRSGYRTIIAWARHGEAERAAYNLDRVKATFLNGNEAPHDPGLHFAASSLREGFLSPSHEAGHHPRAPAAAPPPRRAARRARAPARARWPRSPTCAPG